MIYTSTSKTKRTLREMFLMYIVETKPRWMRYIKKGSDTCKEHISDDNIQQIFEELGLYATEPNEHIILWWNRARNFIRYEEE